MDNITLTDTEARVTEVAENHGITTVKLEWGGPSDRVIEDFQIDVLGEIFKGVHQPFGSCGNQGWVILEWVNDPEVGDIIPLVDYPK